jgi:5'-3' exonuclease
MTTTAWGIAAAVIVGDDADLILMALVSMTPHLHVLNTALSDNQLSLATPVLSVDHLHSSWLAKVRCSNPHHFSWCAGLMLIST